uniref:ABC transporter substrate-binding protein n=1 Tax=Enterocloster sp. TaxID=2719315 RepID=UPI0038901AC3
MKKQISVLTALLTAAAFAVTGCGASGDNTAPSASSKAASQEVPEETEHSEAESTEAENTGAETGSEAVSEEEKEGSGAAAVRVGSLKGPTSMGLAYLMETAKNGETANTYEFTMAGKADELVGNIANGSLDIALVPANVASVLYNKTQGQVKVIDINTLGVLYVVASDDSISTMEDLKGKTVYMTGKGTTPEFAMNYLLAENGLGSGDVTMEFKSEA